MAVWVNQGSVRTRRSPISISWQAWAIRVTDSGVLMIGFRCRVVMGGCLVPAEVEERAEKLLRGLELGEVAGVG